MKRILALVLATLMLATLLAACGNGDTTPAVTDDTTTPPATTDDAPAVEELPPAAQDADADGIEPGASLVYWSMWSEAEPQALVIAEAARAFTAETGVEITINFNGRQGQREGIAPALAAGERIDLFDESVNRVTGQWYNHLLPLDDFVNGVWSDTHGQTFRSLLNDSMMSFAYESGHGSYTVVPYQPNAFVTFYNRDLFEQAGITSVPTTWEEFLAACQALVDVGITPLTVDNAYIAIKFGYTLTRIAGTERTLEIFENFELDDPAVLRTAEVLEDLIQRGFVSPRAATNVFPEGQAGEFAMETVAILLCGTWLPNELREINPDINWGSFAWPAIDPGGDGIEANNFGSQSFAINRATDYPNAAFAFIRWMTLGYWDQVLADRTIGVPMANDATWPPQLADAKAIVEQTTVHVPWGAGAEGDPNTTAAIIDGFQRMVAGTMTAQEFADSLAAITG